MIAVPYSLRVEKKKRSYSNADEDIISHNLENKRKSMDLCKCSHFIKLDGEQESYKLVNNLYYNIRANTLKIRKVKNSNIIEKIIKQEDIEKLENVLDKQYFNDNHIFLKIESDENSIFPMSSIKRKKISKIDYNSLAIEDTGLLLPESDIERINTEFIVWELDQIKVKNFNFDIEDDEFMDVKIFANLMNKNNARTNDKYKRVDASLVGEIKDKILNQQIQLKFSQFESKRFIENSYTLIISLIPLEITNIKNWYNELSIKMEGILNYLDSKTYDCIYK